MNVSIEYDDPNIMCDWCVDAATVFQGNNLTPSVESHKCEYYIRHENGTVSVMGGICNCPCNTEFKTLRP